MSAILGHPYLIGYAGAEMHNYFGTRYATSGMAGPIASSIAMASYIALDFFSNCMAFETPMLEIIFLFLSPCIGSSVATQMGFPIEVEQCVVQTISGFVVLGLAATTINAVARSALVGIIKARDLLRNRT
jgi:hypothetical protein